MSPRNIRFDRWKRREKRAKASAVHGTAEGEEEARGPAKQGRREGETARSEGFGRANQELRSPITVTFRASA